MILFAPAQWYTRQSFAICPCLVVYKVELCYLPLPSGIQGRALLFAPAQWYTRQSFAICPCLVVYKVELCYLPLPSGIQGRALLFAPAQWYTRQSFAICPCLVVYNVELCYLPLPSGIQGRALLFAPAQWYTRQSFAICPCLVVYKVELCSTLYTTRQGQIKSLVCRTSFVLIWPVSLSPQIQKTKTNSWRLFCKSKLENKWKKYILQLRKKKKKRKKKKYCLIFLVVFSAIYIPYHTLVAGYYGISWLSVCSSVSPSVVHPSVFSFPDDNLSKCHSTFNGL